MVQRKSTWLPTFLLAGAFLLPESRNPLIEISQALNGVARKVTPAVVSIITSKSHEDKAASLQFPLSAPESLAPLTMGIGSGVVIRSDGIILTNYHVIEGSEHLSVTFDEKHRYPAHLFGADPKTDLALIQLDKLSEQKLATLPFGNSERLQVGDWIIAVGSPFGLNRSVTAGIVSAIGRERLGMLEVEDFIQTDAAINPGNSGGPLLNGQGEMIGINTALFSQTGDFSGIGFAIPSKLAKHIVEQLLAHGRVIRGWIGISAQDVDEDLAHYFGTSGAKGALISQVQALGPGGQASLKIGDIILQYGQTLVESADHLQSLVSDSKINSQISALIFRDGITRKVELSVLEQPLPKSNLLGQQAGQAHLQKSHDENDHLGLIVQDVPAEFYSFFGMNSEKGVLIANIKPSSPAIDAGLMIGDIILKVNRQEIHTSKDFIKFSKQLNPNKLIVLYVQRGIGNKFFIPIHYTQ